MTTPEAQVQQDADLALAESFRERYIQMQDELHKVIVGQEPTIESLLIALFARGHALLIGVPGLAKTLLVRTLAGTLGWEFKRIQFTPDLMPSDITGTEILQTDPHTGERQLKFVRGPIFANLILADEINRTPPKTQAALLEAMQEFSVTVSGNTLPLALPFMVVATQNPIEHEGTYPLPEAQLDRFMFSIEVGYPEKDDEIRIVDETTSHDTPQVRPLFSQEDVLDLQALVRRVPVSRHVLEYATQLTRATRPDNPTADAFIRNYVEWGAGPRASQYLILGAKVRTLLKGEASPACIDVRAVAPSVLRHRVIPNYNATGEGIGASQIIEHLAKAVKEPSYKE